MEETDKKIIHDQLTLTSGSKTQNWELISLGGIIVLAAVLIFLQRFMEPQQGRDSAYYLLLAEKWYNDGFYGAVDYLSGNFWFPPLHLYLITLLMHCGLSSISAAMLIGMGCGILMPVVTFFITREISKNQQISLAAALFTAVNPSIIEMSVQAQRDVPYLFAVGWSIFFIIAAIKRNKWYWWCLAGIPFAISFLIRYETAEFLPLLGIYFLVSLFKKEQKWYLTFRNLSLFAISGIVFLIILLYISGTLNYMLGAYYRYFFATCKMIQDIYTGGIKK